VPAYVKICQPKLIIILCRNSGGQITHTWVVGPAYRSRIWPTAISGIQKSTKVSYPYNQGRKHPRMKVEYDDRVRSDPSLCQV
jgi:hypothetical protein